MGEGYPQEWETKLAWMRERSVTSATWSPDGLHLTSAEAAPVPVDDARMEQDKQSQTPEQPRRADQRVAFAASGGPRPRIVRQP
jgi:hypothetical protein